MDDCYIDLDLKEKIIKNIPENKQEAVLCSLVSLFINNAPLKFIKQLTGEPKGFEEAELILKQFYRAETFDSLIEDAMKLVGLTNLCLHLDTLDLSSDK